MQDFFELSGTTGKRVLIRKVHLGFFEHEMFKKGTTEAHQYISDNSRRSLRTPLLLGALSLKQLPCIPEETPTALAEKNWAFRSEIIENAPKELNKKQI